MVTSSCDGDQRLIAGGPQGLGIVAAFCITF